MFKNLKELIATMPGEKECRKFMENARWGDSPFCPHCNSTKPYRFKDGKGFRCSNPKCKKDFSVTVGTVFENSKVALSKWLMAVYVIGAHKKGISSIQLAKDIGVTQKTAWFLLHRIRYAMGEPINEPLIERVEVDETYVGGKIPNMSKKRRQKILDSGKDNKVAVMGLVERGGNARLTVIGQRTFKEVIREHVSVNAYLNTDEHSGYKGLEMEFADHAAINHSQGEFLREDVHTNTVEGFFSLLKRTLYGIYHQVSPKHLQRYCDEVTYRYNSRKISDVERFNKMISNVEGRLKYKTLIAKD